jgi:signal transduction histidine kinase/phage shock protein PspC (stress-responsive transcriptional regulator)
MTRRPEKGGLLGLGLFRSPTRRVLGGVAGGIGERLGLDPVFVRIGFALLSLNAGFGVLLYLVLWALVPEGPPSGTIPPTASRRVLGFALMVIGGSILLRGASLWVGDTLAFSLALTILGFGVIWLRSEPEERERLRGLAARLPSNPAEVLGTGRGGRIRVVFGAILVVAGIATFLLRSDVVRAAPAAVFAVATTLVGLAIFLGPWAWRLVRQLSDERRERIRQEERAEMAAHLHDSVLQTLALIQRTDQSKEMVALARSQERELRAWLNGTALTGQDTLVRSIQQFAAAVELQFKVPVEVVTVGEMPLDERARSIVDAAREATVNAAKHSGADHIDVYVEVERDAVTAYVRDEGVGFDPSESVPGRRGIVESIRGRLERSGGRAVVQSEPGEGTEVQLMLPRISP